MICQLTGKSDKRYYEGHGEETASTWQAWRITDVGALARYSVCFYGFLARLVRYHESKGLTKGFRPPP
jgi:hypothetical protein